jgi:hypothetical protein
MSDESKTPGGAEVKADTLEPPRVVHLVSQEGDQYEVDVEVCKMSELVKTMLPEGACPRACVGRDLVSRVMGTPQTRRMTERCRRSRCRM